MNIRMKSSKYRVENILKSTKSRMFKELQIGDIIEFSIKIEEVGRGSSGTYAPLICITNINNGDKVLKSFNQLPRIIENFCLKEE